MKTSALQWMLVLLLISCSKKKDYLIQVPDQTRITSEWILSELEEKAKEEPENEWLLNQQLYFCEQMEWPLRCEQVLRRAREKWGLSERLIDQFVAFYVKQDEFGQLETILTGAVESRNRLEAQVRIGINKTPPDVSFLEKFLGRFDDEEANIMAIEAYLMTGDTTKAILYIEKLANQAPNDQRLARFYPILTKTSQFKTAIKILGDLLQDDPKNDRLRFDLALNYYGIQKKDSAFSLLRKLDSDSSNSRLHYWFKESNQWDSALYYLAKVTALSKKKDLIVSKAEIYENRGWLTGSLPIYESALALDTTDLEMRQRVEIVRRKVASLRQNRVSTPTKPNTKP